jgi:hypothetical protein
MRATAKPSRPAIFLPIRPGTIARKCRYCPKFIYLSPHPSTGKLHPIAIDTDVRSYGPTSTTVGQGITHYADCPNAPFKRARRILDIREARSRTADLECIHCGCTDEKACPGGCEWVSLDPPMCSSCAFYDEPLSLFPGSE